MFGFYGSMVPFISSMVTFYGSPSKGLRHFVIFHLVYQMMDQNGWCCMSRGHGQKEDKGRWWRATCCPRHHHFWASPDITSAGIPFGGCLDSWTDHPRRSFLRSQNLPEMTLGFHNRLMCVHQKTVQQKLFPSRLRPRVSTTNHNHHQPQYRPH